MFNSKRIRVWGRMAGGLALGAIATFALPAAAQAQNDVVSVEEDWELVLHQPDAEISAPQIATQMLPDAANLLNFNVFCLNFQEIPDFEEGGFEIQLWEGDYNTHAKSASRTKFASSGETVLWTQTLWVQNSKLNFGVSNGQSATFGSFGGGAFKVSSFGDCGNLNAYDVATSVSRSAVPFGANRVAKLRIVQVRKTYSDGTVVVDSTSHDVVAN